MCKVHVVLPLGGERIVERAGATRRVPHTFGEGEPDAKQASEEKQSIIHVKVQIQGDTRTDLGITESQLTIANWQNKNKNNSTASLPANPKLMP